VMQPERAKKSTTKKKPARKATAKKTSLKKPPTKKKAVKKAPLASRQSARKKVVAVKKKATVKKAAVKPAPTRKKSKAIEKPAAAVQELQAPADTPILAGLESDLREVRAELRAVRELMERALPGPIEAETDPALEGSVDALRRLLSATIEDRLESTVGELASIRSAALADSPDRLDAVVSRIDRLLGGLGAVPFDAERLDYLDPLIHEPVAERHDPDAPTGVVLETVRPGFRTGRGAVAARACVVVNGGV